MRDLQELKLEVISAIKSSGQGAYARRLPSSDTSRQLMRASLDLECFLKKNPDSVEAYRLISLANEVLLNYDKAIFALKKSMSLSKLSDKKDLKKIAGYEEQLRFWEILTLSPAELRDLGIFLEERLKSEEYLDHSFKWTQEWLSNHNHINSKNVIAGLEKLGAYDDFQVFYNIVNG